MGGESLRSVCRDDAMPSRETVYQWLSKHEAFADQYAKACDVRADQMFDEIFEIADDGTNDFTEQDGEARVNGEHIQRSRLRIDARKWALSKMMPKKYGDKLDLNHSGGVTVTLERDAEDL